MNKEAPQIEDDDEDNTDLKERSKNLAKTKKIKDHLTELYRDIEKGFTDQLQRASDTQDYWDLHNNILGANQSYNGQSRIFVPIVYGAIKARKTRFTNQIFPKSGRYVEVSSSDGTAPDAIMSLAEHYVRKARLRELMPAILRNGDVEGQFNLYVDWSERKRHVVNRVKRPAKIEPGMAAPDEDVEDIEEETLKAAHPTVEILADSDVCVLPSTASTVEDAIAAGGSVTILRRWTKAKIKSLIAEGQIDSKEGEALVKEMSKQNYTQTPDKGKAMSQAAGIKGVGQGKFTLIYETWAEVKTSEGYRICRTYFGGATKILSCVRNPYWSDRIPLLSAPLEKVQGSFKGISQVQAVADLQYLANDTMNKAADSMSYGLMPIVMTDPEKNPRVGSMVLDMAAIWETNPNDTKIIQFPPLWKDGLEIVAGAKQEIFQTLSVNPAQITQGTKKKLSQAEVANEQQVDLLTTADVVTVIEEVLLSPLITRFIELDHQFRDEAVQIRAFGELGMRASMQDIEPIQMGARYEFKWLGVEAARNVQQVQQQITFINVLKGIPPQMYPGYKLDIAPILKQLTENNFGPRLAPLVFKDIRSSLSVDPNKENQLLSEGHTVPVHPMDDHQQHMQIHSQAMQEDGDPHGTFRTHLLEHQMALMQQAQAQQEAMAPKGMPGGPGGAGPGVAGAPRPGAQAGPPRGGQQPPGMIKQDQMNDPSVMPRRMG